MATIRTHTTLRTLFVATAVFAVLAAMWTAGPPVGPLPYILTPCAASFIAALFGLSLGAGFLIGLATVMALVTFSNATPSGSVEYAIARTIDDAFMIACVFGAPLLTAAWWGKYLRYVWSKPKRSREANESSDEDSPVLPRTATLQERMLVRCELTPVGIFIITVLANVLILMVIAAIVPARLH